MVPVVGLEPTRIKRYMREMQYLSGFFVLFSCTKGIKNTLSE
nr:MAG TPA: transmembrane protein [Caudoviricetes sp.]